MDWMRCTSSQLAMINGKVLDRVPFFLEIGRSKHLAKAKPQNS